MKFLSAIPALFFIFLLALLLVGVAQASELIIANGETYTISEDQRELHLTKLIMGDKATIKFAEGVTYWDLRADYVKIGHDVTVDGRGADGIDSSSITAATERAGSCTNGMRGKDGEPGGRGGNGVDIQMRLVITELNSMKVLLDGGNGGMGGSGIAGQQGGLAKACEPTDGGDGGNGGVGGMGGNGGKLVISLSAVTPGGSLMALSHQIEANSDAGYGGRGGEAGAGGSGSDGQFINQKTLTGDKKWVAGGKKGKSGLVGEAGKKGSEGRVFIGGGELAVTPIAPSAVPVEKTAISAASSQQKKELEDLKTQMRLMQQRLDAMEKQNH